MHQCQRLQEGSCGLYRFSQHGEKPSDLFGDLFGARGLAERGEDGGEHEFHKGGGVPRLVAGGEHLIVICLTVADDGFDGKPGRGAKKIRPSGWEGRTRVFRGLTDRSAVVSVDADGGGFGPGAGAFRAIATDAEGEIITDGVPAEEATGGAVGEDGKGVEQDRLR